jgi:cold-inducible RNA-binding protein
LTDSQHPARFRPASISPLSNSKEIKVKNIYVGNLDFSATEESIRSLFAPYGTVEKVHLATDRETGRSRGFAFVEMADDGGADKAITALNGTNLGGRALNVNEARPKADRAASGSEGGYRGGRGRGPRW